MVSLRFLSVKRVANCARTPLSSLVLFRIQAHATPRSLLSLLVAAMSSRLRRILSLALLSLGLSFAAPASLETAQVQHTLVHTKPGEGAIRQTDFIHELRQVTRTAAVTTLYNPFEATIPTTKANAGKGHHLAPVSQVFRVMTVKGPKATSPPVSPPPQTTTTQVIQPVTTQVDQQTTQVDQQTTTQEDQQTTATEAPSEPTVPSGGLVVLTSSDDVPAETETPISEPSATPTPKTPVSHHPLEKVAVLGGALGGIALIALLTFIIMHPCVSRLWRREQPPKRPKKVRTPSWMRVLPVSPVLPEADEKGISGHSADLWGNQRMNQRAPDIGPASPDSKYSSSSSRRSSSGSCYDVPVLASGAPYNSAAAPASPSLAQYKAAYNKATSGAPPRPKRPPTEDGPGALSDAMILACANQPSAKQSPLLSPKEFFTMPTSPSEQDAPALLVSSPSHDHTRAHSAPQKLVVRNASVNDRILHDDSVPSGIGRKMLEHRRSRSASGWAYPKRPQGPPRNLRKPQVPHYSAQFENVSGDP